MILGVDPGIQKCGYALIHTDAKVEEAGILTFDKKNTDRINQYERMEKIHQFFSELLEKYDITTVCMERYFITSFNMKNAEFIYGMRGIILMLCLQRQIKIKEYTPIELKKRITGNGKANKMLMQKMVMKLYNLQDIPAYHDAADALGLARIGKK